MKKFWPGAVPAKALLGGVALAVLVWRHRPGRSLQGATAVITGGSRGLGLCLALELARQGARLHLIARDAAELDRAAAKVRRAGAEVSVWPCDLRDESATVAALESIGAEAGRVDLLINNAGSIVVAPWDTLEAKDFEDAMALHFWAPFHTTKAAFPFLAKAHGHIVNIVSIGGRVAIPHLAGYSASKFALAGLSHAMRAEMVSACVGVTTVYPGLMRTGSHLNARFKGDVDREYTWFSLAATTPLTAINAHRAARQIIAAARRRQPSLTITWQAKMLTFLHALAPSSFDRAAGLINGLLPRSEGRKVLVSGKNCFSSLPSCVSLLGERAAGELNETSH